jgi:UDP-N-acetylmuramoyl-tripeptide--D-alanyl-D-alanine ligase
MEMVEAKSQKLMANGQQPDIYYYGQSDNQDILIRGEVVSCAPFLKFRWREQDADAGYTSEWMEVQTNLIGAYNLDNMLAAITVGYVNNVPFEQINHALASYVPTNNRSQLVNTGHNCLIVDAYNANPTSMKAALDNFRRIEAPHKMVILGMMGELADVSADEHRKVVARLQKDQIEEVWLVGSEFERIESPYRTFADVEAVKAELKANRPEGRTILIKGSNANRLFELPELL